tara:strand:+ start:549 stop:953 length:405 start_codon:yes stop_codon:yes gene_type:complete
MGKKNINPSIHISHVHKNINKFTIRLIFENILGKSTISHIDIIKQYNSTSIKKYSKWNKVFVYIHTWLPSVEYIKKLLIDGYYINVNCYPFVEKNMPPVWACNYLQTSISKTQKPYNIQQYPVPPPPSPAEKLI